MLPAGGCFIGFYLIRSYRYPVADTLDLPKKSAKMSFARLGSGRMLSGGCPLFADLHAPPGWKMEAGPIRPEFGLAG